MKNLFFGICAIALAVSFSAFTSARLPQLQVDASVNIDATNVTSGASYVPASSYTCFSTPQKPCTLDLGLINPSFGVTDEATFIAYLNSAFATPAARVAEVERITVARKVLQP